MWTSKFPWQDPTSQEMLTLVVVQTERESRVLGDAFVAPAGIQIPIESLLAEAGLSMDAYTLGGASRGVSALQDAPLAEDGRPGCPAVGWTVWRSGGQVVGRRVSCVVERTDGRSVWRARGPAVQLGRLGKQMPCQSRCARYGRTLGPKRCPSLASISLEPESGELVHVCYSTESPIQVLSVCAD